jgi:outer membrane protein assembly factor BamB
MHLSKTKVLIVLVISLFIIPGIVQGISRNQGIQENANLEYNMNPTTSNNIDWWPMFHHDPNNTGYSTSYGPDTNNVLWIFNAIGIVNSPSVIDGKIYIGTNKVESPFWSESFVYCLDVDGNEIWASKTSGDLDSSPSVVDGKVYIGSKNGNVYCLDADNGDYIWSVKTGDRAVSSPIIVDGKVTIGSMDGNVYCLDAGTGEKIWSNQIGIDIRSSPAIVNGKVYIGNYCLNADNGNEIWRSEIGTSLVSSPAVYNNKIYIGSVDEKVHCLDADTGEKIWSYHTGSMIRQSSPAIAYGKVYVGTAFRYVYCLDADNGEYSWSAKTGDRLVSSPAVCDGKVYIGSFDKNLYCFDAYNGSKIWNYQTNETFDCSPAIADGKVYIGGGNKLYCFGSNQQPIPNLDCEGALCWTEVEPDSLVGDSITVTNIGQSSSKLDWKIESYPDWGNWTFTPSSGDDLKPSDGSVTVGVFIVAPNMEKSAFTGEVKIVNKDNSSDYSTISVSLTTPKNKAIGEMPLFLRFLENHPNIFPLIGYLLGLQ